MEVDLLRGRGLERQESRSQESTERWPQAVDGGLSF